MPSRPAQEVLSEPARRRQTVVRCLLWVLRCAPTVLDPIILGAFALRKQRRSVTMWRSASLILREAEGHVLFVMLRTIERNTINSLRWTTLLKQAFRELLRATRSRRTVPVGAWERPRLMGTLLRPRISILVTLPDRLVNLARIVGA